MLSYEESQCGESPQLITPLRTSRASPANQMSSWLPSVSRVALISRGRPLRVQMVTGGFARPHRSEEHTSELQSLRHIVCRLLLEKKKEILNRYDMVANTL